MKVILVKRNDPPGYGENESVVVIAEDFKQARAMAARVAADEGANAWRASETKCLTLGISARKRPEVVSISNAGA